MLEQKKRFITWFMNHFQPKKREAIWLLNYMKGQDSLLERIHFVDDCQNTPKSISISSFCSNHNDTPLYMLCYNQKIIDPDKIFHEIRLNHDEPLYIELHFNNQYQYNEYIDILEDNPFLSTDVPTRLNEEDENELEKFLDFTLISSQEKIWKKRIDESLDQKNEHLFMELTNSYYSYIKDFTTID